MKTDLYTLLGYRFRKSSLLKQALTHPSRKEKRLSHDYERLEFVGDRVLALVVAEMLYGQYPRESEGDLAKRLAASVRKEACVFVAKQLDLASHMTLMTEDITEHSAVLCDAIEALIGAIFIDGGLDPARTFIQTYWAPLIKQCATPPKDAKSHLQEWSQHKRLGIPTYNLLSHTGPEHLPNFEVRVSAGPHEAIGHGPSKRMAEQAAAQQLLEKVKNDRQNR